MKLYLTGEPCSQQRHCYFVEGNRVSFIVDCGYQRCYEGDELPHLLPEQIRASRYLFLTHSHENQSGALPALLSREFTGRVVMTTETARQLPFPVDDPIVLEGLCLPYTPAELPGGLTVTEALCKKLPMILVNPIPGHEERNVEFLMNNGAALRVSHNFSVCEAVYYLYTNPERLTLMSRCIELIAKPDAAQRICDLAESICSK